MLITLSAKSSLFDTRPILEALMMEDAFLKGLRQGRLKTRMAAKLELQPVDPADSTALYPLSQKHR